VKPEKIPTLRELPDWLSEFMEMGTFTWYPNLYTVLVAPPGIVSKSSTSDLGMRLLKQIPGIHQGPTTLTWQSLYDAFKEVGSEFEVSPTEVRTQFPLYINSSELGITLKMSDTDMVDQLVHMWDGYELKKRTRLDGEMIIPTPSLNLIACTTPSWIAENVPQYLIGGGLTSRILFVYGDKKERYIAYPQRSSLRLPGKTGSITYVILSAFRISSGVLPWPKMRIRGARNGMNISISMRRRNSIKLWSAGILLGSKPWFIRLL
jgi:hypothetical protein